MRISIGKFGRVASIFLVAALIQGEACMAQQWYSIGLNSVGDHVLIDADRLQFEGSIARYWVRQDFKEPQWASNLSSGIGGFLAGALKSKVAQSVELYEADCDQVSGAVLSRTRRSESGEVIDNVNLASSGSGLRNNFPPGSMGARAVDFVCKRGKTLKAGGAEAAPLVPFKTVATNWKRVSQNQVGIFYVAMDMITSGSSDSSGTRFFFSKTVYSLPFKLGQSSIAELIQLQATQCSQRDQTLIGDVAYAADRSLLYRAEYPDAKPVVYGPGTIGQLMLDEVCRANFAEDSNQTRTVAKSAEVVKPPQQMLSSGTAWLSASGYFITAFHVIADTTSIALYGTDMRPLQARVIAADERNDVALLWADLKGRNVRPIPFAHGATALGSRVFTIGYPHSDLLGVSPKVTSGELSGTLPLDPTKVLISVPVQSGNSGGPLINMNGEAVGLVIQKLSATKVFKETGDLTENTNFALRVKYVDALIDDQPKIEAGVGFPKIKGTQLEDWVAAYKDSVFFVVGTTSKPSK